MGVHLQGETDEAAMSDINVTPLVDVMLVLLIIFMITAPMLHQGVEVALPQTVAAESIPMRVDDPLVLSVKTECLDGMILFGEDSLRRALTEYVTHHGTERPHTESELRSRRASARGRWTSVDGAQGFHVAKIKSDFRIAEQVIAFFE